MRRALFFAAGAAVGLIGVRRLAFGEGIEEPAFETLSKEGPFEVRSYPPRLIAETTVEGGYRASLNEGFRRLAGFIFGGNQRREPISMTAPVGHRQASEKIAMTAPVEARPRAGEHMETSRGEPVAVSVPDAGGWVVTFTMPSKYTAQTLPRPLDPRVEIRQTPAARVAALSFSGLATEERVARKERQLLDLLSRKGLSAAGEPSVAQYDPPWTLPFLRRNEILVELA